jgi:hypothetical protein
MNDACFQQPPFINFVRFHAVAVGVRVPRMLPVDVPVSKGPVRVALALNPTDIDAVAVLEGVIVEDIVALGDFVTKAVTVVEIVTDGVTVAVTDPVIVVEDVVEAVIVAVGVELPVAVNVPVPVPVAVPVPVSVLAAVPVAVPV